MILKIDCMIYKCFWITSKTLLNGPFIRTDLIEFQYYSFILQTIDIKLYKPEQTKHKKGIINQTFWVKFVNKALKLKSMVVFQLTDKSKNNDNNSTYIPTW